MHLEDPDFPPAAGHRFFVHQDAWKTDTLTLLGGEARHCAEVLRHRAGDRVTAFDGRGREAACTITEVSKRSVTLTIVSERRISKPALDLVLIQAIAKSKAMDWLVQKATEIGVTRICPVTTERTVVKIKSAPDATKHREKWERIALETAKQCTRAWLPEITDPQPLATILKQPPASELRIVAALDAETLPLRAAIESHPERPHGATVLVGPEGDLSSSELDEAKAAGFVPVTLGQNILRSETAALVALSVLAHELTP